jgi:hypothetical protein
MKTNASASAWRPERFLENAPKWWGHAAVCQAADSRGSTAFDLISWVQLEPVKVAG